MLVYLNGMYLFLFVLCQVTDLNQSVITDLLEQIEKRKWKDNVKTEKMQENVRKCN